MADKQQFTNKQASRVGTALGYDYGCFCGWIKYMVSVEGEVGSLWSGCNKVTRLPPSPQSTISGSQFATKLL